MFRASTLLRSVSCTVRAHRTRLVARVNQSKKKVVFAPEEVCIDHLYRQSVLQVGDGAIEELFFILTRREY